MSRRLENPDVSKTLAELADLIGGRVLGDADCVVSGVSGIREAREGQITFLANPKYSRYLTETSASAVIVAEDAVAESRASGKPLLVVENVYSSLAQAVELFTEPLVTVTPGVHPTAVVHESVELGEGSGVGATAVVLRGTTIGSRTVIHPGAYVGPGVRIGDDTVVYPNATVKAGTVLGDRVIIHSGAVIGSDGFGYAKEGDTHRKIPQVGRVIVEDDVEIGANACIDRATMGATLISRGTKIDNLVQIGHNVVIGEGSIVVAQVGISGSTVLGKSVVLAGQTGVAGHIKIGDGAVVGAQSGVTKSIDPGEQVSGYPAQKHTVAKRLNACVQRLPSLFEKLKELERRLSRLEKEE